MVSLQCELLGRGFDSFLLRLFDESIDGGRPFSGWMVVIRRRIGVQGLEPVRRRLCRSIERIRGSGQVFAGVK